ncbi:MAG: hypothetical protein ACYDCQ_22715 [Dehalococcoidia bacterium]
MAIIILLAVLLVLTVACGMFSYGRTLGRGPYSGSMAGAFRVATVLGACLGVSVALFTLIAVLILRQAR